MSKDLIGEFVSAIKNNQISQAKSVLKNGVDANAIYENPLYADYDGSFIRNEKIPLINLAAEKGDFDLIKSFIEKGVNVNLKSDLDDTPLKKACKAGYYEIAELLIANGADVNAKDQFGDCILSNSICSQKEAIVNLLLNNGVDVNSKNETGKTPLHFAARQLFSIIDLLIEKGADVKALDYSGTTVLIDLIAENHILYCDKDLLLKQIRLLIDLGVDVNAQTKEPLGYSGTKSALAYAAYMNYIEIVSLLLEAGAKDIDSYYSAYESAKKRRNEAIVQLLENRSS